MTTVAVIDYGMGNLRSVCKAIEHVSNKARVMLTSDPATVRKADRVVFPGQGAIAGCVAALDQTGLREVVLEVLESKPFLGVCLGLQALYDYSDEGGGIDCLGKIPGRVKLFPSDMRDSATNMRLKIPHMGWNQVHQTKAHPLWKDISQDERFYFVHSYYADTSEHDYIAATTDYGVKFTSAVSHENFFAVQFHPEKSQHAGLQLLTNFVSWDGAV
ncbi:MAG: imidazole glycerol phosphate synthase subunit HisH [Gammaproteobacteria bacterium]|nr:imidazole glycerol phosphate synthase subunit HisH [Gammaproteobacteria bacterium]